MDSKDKRKSKESEQDKENLPKAPKFILPKPNFHSIESMISHDTSRISHDTSQISHDTSRISHDTSRSAEGCQSDAISSRKKDPEPPRINAHVYGQSFPVASSGDTTVEQMHYESVAMCQQQYAFQTLQTYQHQTQYAFDTQHPYPCPPPQYPCQSQYAYQYQTQYPLPAPVPGQYPYTYQSQYPEQMQQLEQAQYINQVQLMNPNQLMNQAQMMNTGQLLMMGPYPDPFPSDDDCPSPRSIQASPLGEIPNFSEKEIEELVDVVSNHSPCPETDTDNRLSSCSPCDLSSNSAISSPPGVTCIFGTRPMHTVSPENSSGYLSSSGSTGGSPHSVDVLNTNSGFRSSSERTSGQSVLEQKTFLSMENAYSFGASDHKSPGTGISVSPYISNVGNKTYRALDNVKKSTTFAGVSPYQLISKYKDYVQINAVGSSIYRPAHVVSSDCTNKTTDDTTASPLQSPSLIQPQSFISPGPRSPDLPDSTKKKSRTFYNADQLKTLEDSFLENAYPDWNKFEALALELGIAEQKIKTWFQNKRARMKRKQVSLQGRSSPYTEASARNKSIPAFFGMMCTTNQGSSSNIREVKTQDNGGIVS